MVNEWVSVSLQLCPASQSETVSPWASSCSPVSPRLWSAPRFPESSAGCQDGHRCLAAAAPTSPRSAIRGWYPLCRIHCKNYSWLMLILSQTSFGSVCVCLWDDVCVRVFRIKQKRRALASTRCGTLWQGWFGLLKPCWVPPLRLVLW